MGQKHREVPLVHYLLAPWLELAHDTRSRVQHLHRVVVRVRDVHVILQIK